MVVSCLICDYRELLSVNITLSHQLFYRHCPVSPLISYASLHVPLNYPFASLHSCYSSQSPSLIFHIPVIPTFIVNKVMEVLR